MTTSGVLHIFQALALSAADIVPLSLVCEDFWLKAFRARLNSRKLDIPSSTRWWSSFADSFGGVSLSADFKNIWCFWDYTNNRLGVLNHAHSASKAFSDNVIIRTPASAEPSAEDFSKNWYLSILYEQSLDVLELDYAPHGAVDPEDTLFAIPRPSNSYAIAATADPDAVVFEPSNYTPMEVLHSNRIETTRNQKFKVKHYGSFRTVMYATDHDIHRDEVVPDYGYFMDSDFYDRLYKKDHIVYRTDIDALYSDYWWYTKDLARSLLFNQPSVVHYSLTDELLDPELPTPWFKSDVILCDTVFEEIFPPLTYRNNNHLFYQATQQLPRLQQYANNPLYAPERIYDENDLTYVICRYDYYSRLEFIDNRAEWLVEEFMKSLLLTRSEI